MQESVYSPLEYLQSALLDEKRVRLYVKRDDLIHPEVSGNKWRKLKYNIIECKRARAFPIISFGGAFSNHIYSLAAAGKIAQVPTLGVIRGEEVDINNPTLSFASAQGMKILPVSRKTYRDKNGLVESLKSQYPNATIIPEGGSNALGVKGCTEIINEIDIDFDYLTTAVGTGGTISGLINGLNGNKNVLGFPVLKGVDYLNDEIKNLTNGSFDNWKLEADYHFGGYAKFNEELLSFMKEFKTAFGIQLEPIYTAKHFFGVFDLIKKDYFPEGSVIVMIHTGGLQGLKGFGLS